jgi:hypothetical protein
MKRFKLLRELPNVTVGSIISQMSDGTYVVADKYGGLASFNKSLVESHPDWFLQMAERHKLLGTRISPDRSEIILVFDKEATATLLSKVKKAVKDAIK